MRVGINLSGEVDHAPHRLDSIMAISCHLRPFAALWQHASGITAGPVFRWI